MYAKDCLEVLKDRRAIPDESVDLIYLDPPFNSKSKYNLPFKGKYKKDSKPVMAFKDTWSWNENEIEHLTRLEQGDAEDMLLADIVKLSRRIFNEKPNATTSTGAYLLNMAVRLKEMRRVLKPTGSIYLHCDPTASHYLKAIMDSVFGEENFCNEVVWHYYNGTSNIQRAWVRKHDINLFYARDAEQNTFNEDEAREPYAEDSNFVANPEGYKDKYKPHPLGKRMHAVWRIPTINNMAKERLGYPTQKPLELLRRIIKASSNEGDVILDPFCGCGTTVHAAEELRRRWIGVDVSQFSVGLIRNRILDNFRAIDRQDIHVVGCPMSVNDALELARRDKFEFEKWACGEVGAQGLFHAPGERGADGGVDGIIPFYHSESLADGKAPEKTFAVVQVKGGKVHPDSVKALSTTVRESGAKCGVLICFEKYMRTVNNNREKRLVKHMEGDFNFIQGLSVEDLVNGRMPNLPLARYAA